MLAVVPLGTGAGADPTFVTGSGRARASLFEIVPRTGGLEIPINFGKALATYRGLSATATSGGVKPPSQKGADGDCGGGAKPPGGGGGGGGGGAPAPPRPGGGKGPSTTFPFTSTLSVSTGDEGAEHGKEIDQGSFPVGSPISGRFELQQVFATARPSARAITTAGAFGFGSGVELLNARTDADTGIVEGGQARIAHAVTTIDRLSLFGDAVTLIDVRWEVTQRTGEDEASTGQFTVGKVFYGGESLPPNLPVILPNTPNPQTPDPLAALNTALAPSGISVVAPHFETAGGVARVTPLTFRFADSALGRVVLGPVVGSFQPLRDPVVGGLLAISCDFGTAVTVADVATSVLTGSGGISFDFGGVTATTEGESYDNPLAGGPDQGGGGFGSDTTGSFPDGGLPDLGGTSGPAVSGPATDVGAGASTDYGSSSTGAGLGDAGASGAASSPGSGAGLGSGSGTNGGEVAYADPAGLYGSTSRHVPGSKGGRALVVAALALLTVAALAAADAFHLRRASRSIS